MGFIAIAGGNYGYIEDNNIRIRRDSFQHRACGDICRTISSAEKYQKMERDKGLCERNTLLPASFYEVRYSGKNYLQKPSEPENLFREGVSYGMSRRGAVFAYRIYLSRNVQD